MDASTIFGPKGPVSRIFEGRGRTFRPSPQQIQVATAVQETCAQARDISPPIRLIEAGTGVGKTLAYLISAAVHAVGEGRPALVSTYTVALMTQIVSEDWPVAADAVQEMGLRRPVLGIRRGRRAFVSASRTNDLAAQTADPVLAAALPELAAWATECNRRSADLLRQFDGGRIEIGDIGMDGMLESWTGRHPDGHAILAHRDEICLLGTSSEAEQNCYRLMCERARHADVLLTTHAWTAIDLFRDGALSKLDRPYSIVVIDEADRFSDAAESSLSTSVALSTVHGIIDRLHEAEHRVRESEGKRLITEQARKLEQALQPLTKHAEELRSSLGSELFSAADPKTVQLLLNLSPAMGEVVETLSSQATGYLNVDAIRECANSLRTLARAAVDQSETPFWSLRWRFSPRLGRPSLATVPAVSGRIAKRLWTSSGASCRSRAVILTSATLAVPGFGEAARWKSIARATGVDLTDANRVSWEQIEPDRGFGTMRFVLIDPESPVPSPGPGGRLTAEGAASIARVIEEAARHGERVLALCCSFQDVSSIAPRLSSLGGRLLVHSDDTTLDGLLRQYRASGDAVLLTPGAWEGVNLPGMVPRLVICRLPFPPPQDRQDACGNVKEGFEHVERVEGMLRKLRQGLGRAIRSATDECTVYVADPRFPLPPEVGLPLGLLAHQKAQAVYAKAVPSRFVRALREARIFDPAIVTPSRRRAA